MSELLTSSHASSKRQQLMTILINDLQCGDFKDWNKLRGNSIVCFEVNVAMQRAATQDGAEGENSHDDDDNDKWRSLLYCARDQQLIFVILLVVHWCVYRIIDRGCGSFFDVVIVNVVDGLIFVVWRSAQRKLCRQWSLPTRWRRETHLREGMCDDRCSRPDRWDATWCCANPAWFLWSEASAALWSTRCARLA